jgi:UPF0176 protein
VNKKTKPPKLYNTITRDELLKQLANEVEPRITISFYKYFNIDTPNEFRDQLYRDLGALKVFGRIYVAGEGINAQISVPKSYFDKLQQYLNSLTNLKNIHLNIAYDDTGKSFWVLKIKVRKQIVFDNIIDNTFNISKNGKYVTPVQFNQMLEHDKTTVIVDMRNHYEYEVGHFENAIEIPSETFREQLPMSIDMLKHQKDAKIVMYCTGGIRCEKASAFLLHNGFKNVFHLQGGIINYINTVKQFNLPNKFRGKMFVFDGRLGEKIGEEIIAKCHQCDHSADNHVNCANSACHLLFIQCDKCAQKYSNCCSQKCQAIINLPPEQQDKIRKGIDQGSKIFNKAKSNLKNYDTSS